MELKEAIKKAQENNQFAFNFLLDRYWNDVYGFLLQRTKNENDAEDISIQTFARAFDKIDTYNDSYQFNTWLITIAKNIHLDQIRSKKSSIVHETTEDHEERVHSIVDVSPTPEDKIITEQNLARLLRDIKKLKPHYQEVINLRFFQEYSYEEIAKELNESMNNVKVKLLRAKKLLAEIIQKQ